MTYLYIKAMLNYTKKKTNDLNTSNSQNTILPLIFTHFRLQIIKESHKKVGLSWFCLLEIK